MRGWFTVLRLMTAGIAVAGGMAALAPQARASFVIKNATFTDNTPLTGDFSTTVYGYIDQSSVNLLSIDGLIAGWNYLGGYGQPNNGGIVLGATGIDFYRAPGGVPDYSTDLHLAFTAPVHAGLNLLDTTDSYECLGSYSCFLPGDSGDRRYFASGALDLPVPEPTSLAMLGSCLLGFGMIRRKWFG
jgi:PEP-CTERM motif